MRTLAAMLLVALFVISSGHASAAGYSLIVSNHEETLDDLLDSSEALDEYLGPLGFCLRESAVKYAKGIYGSEDKESNPHTCTGTECFRPSPGDPFLSVDNCYAMLMKLIDDVIEYITGGKLWQPISRTTLN